MNFTSLKTTTCGVLCTACPIIATFYPEHARLMNAVAAVAAGIGLMFARDNNVTSAQVAASKEPSDSSPPKTE
jgi:hypothetical protein